MPLEERTLGDSDARREDIALDLRGGANGYRLCGIQVALHLAVDEDDSRANVTLHGTVGPHRQALRMRDRTLDAALDDQVFLCRQLAAKAQAGAQHGRSWSRLLRTCFGGTRLRSPMFGRSMFGRSMFRCTRFRRARLGSARLSDARWRRPGLDPRLARFGTRYGGFGRGNAAA